MKQLLFLGVLVSLFFACSTKQDKSEQHEKLTQYVDPFIGTGFHGHTFPGAAVPSGMIQLSPDNGTAAWDWCSGYHYSDSLIAGFSHLHLSGTGIGDLADLSVMPTNKEIAAKHFDQKKTFSEFYRSKYSHKDETAKAGYYQVKLLDDNINAEFTVTDRVGFHRYTFANPKNKSIIFDLGFMINWDRPHEGYVKKVSDNMIVGYRHSKGWANYQKVFFVAEFSKPFSNFETFCTNRKGDEAEGAKTKAVLSFPEKMGNELLLKVAISSASIEGAMKNLKSDKNGWNFDKVAQLADQKWENELEKISVETNDTDKKTIFYTAMYHSLLAPYTFSDIDGGYKGYDHKTHFSKDHTRYTVLSLWDTFRALKPLFTIIRPDLTNDIIKTMLDQYDQTGLLPVWELMGNETGCMIGYHAIPVVADAILKNIGNFDHEHAYKAMIASSMTNIEGLEHYRKYKYIPADKENESASKTLAYCYDDWCIAQVAKKLGKTDDYEKYMERSKYYKNLFDTKMKFIRGKNSNGKWAVPFDPKFSRHRDDYFTEGNSWQWTWFAPHDVEGLTELMGGKEEFVKKLNELFNESSEIKGDHASADISGLIGQYAHGNEPSHHTAYLFNMVGQPAYTQKYIHEILTTMYSSKPDGLRGNEDCGQMSAWYVFSAIGFYPANAASGEYQFGSPLFNKATINLPSGNKFVVEANNVSDKNIYIQSVELNGKKLDRTFITHDELIKGGKLVFKMTSTPASI